MRVLHWYPNFHGGGGVAIAVAGLASAQQELGAHVAIAAASPAKGRTPLYEQPTVDSVELLTWQPRWSRDAAGLRIRGMRGRDRRALRQWGPDVVHIHGEFQPDNLRVPWLFGCPVVLEPCGAFHPAILNRRTRAKRAYIRLARHLLYRRVRAFHAYGAAEVEHVGAVVPTAQVYAVTQGINPAVPVRATRPAANRSGVAFLFAGRLDVYVKGLDRLLDAFALARDELGTGASLTIVGPPQAGSVATLRERAAALGIGDAVHLTGAMTGTELADALAAADVYVQVSRHEGFTMTVAEALLSARPVVVTNAIGVASLDGVRSLEHVVITDEGVDDIAAALVTSARDLDRLTAAAAAAQPGLRELLSWRTAARSHLDRYAILGAAS